MVRIAIIPTGRMEWEGMAPALRSLFTDDGCEFYALPTPEEVATMSKNDEFPASSFTSCDVTRIEDQPNKADDLVARAVAAALGDRRIKAADMVVIIDDLELANLSQPDAVVRAMRKAAARHLSRFEHDVRLQERTREALRERVSFHLIKPMIESWILSYPEGPVRAGVPPEREVRLEQTGDPEDVRAADPSYAADTGAACAAWHALPERTRRERKKKNKLKPAWVKAGHQRNLHPKAYLSWLCMQPQRPKCSAYDESRGGAQALCSLGWEHLLVNPTAARFARALVHDIAECLQIDPPYPGEVASSTARSALPRDPLMRNL